MSDTHGTVHWTELMTRDVAAAKAYYEAVCGWTFKSMDMPDSGTYHIAHVGEDMVAGMMDLADMEGMDQMPPQWFTYLAVDDVDAAVEATRSAGGQVMQAPFDVPGVGRIAMVMDPAGAGIGLMTPS